MRVNKARNRTHEEKNKIDEYHLELQNLLYEISHLKNEINKCLEFRFVHYNKKEPKLFVDFKIFIKR